MNTDTIKIDGKDFPIKFGNGCIKRFCMNHVPPFEDLGEFYNIFSNIDTSNLTLKSFDDISLIIYSAIQSGCDLKGVECSLTYDQLYELLGDDLEIMPQAMKIFAGTTPKDTKKKTAQAKEK